MGAAVGWIFVSAFFVGLTQVFAYLSAGSTDPFLPGGITAAQSVAVWAVAVNFISYIPAYAFQTEHYYDITGTFTYVTMMAYSFAAGLVAAHNAAVDEYNNNTTLSSGPPTVGDVVSPRAALLTSTTLVWALRLGAFLLRRVKRQGKDGRFDRFKPKPFVFLMVWMLQALWCSLTALAVTTVNVSQEQERTDGATPFGQSPADYIGIVVWVLGFGIEVVADQQKTWWRAKKPEERASANPWIEEGLWKYSRHPNYFGECLLWIGVFIVSAPAFRDTQWAAAVSPVFVVLLITQLSGIPLLEKSADEKWGG